MPSQFPENICLQYLVGHISLTPQEPCIVRENKGIRSRDFFLKVLPLTEGTALSACLDPDRVPYSKFCAQGHFTCFVEGGGSGTRLCWFIYRFFLTPYVVGKVLLSLSFLVYKMGLTVKSQDWWV